MTALLPTLALALALPLTSGSPGSAHTHDALLGSGSPLDDAPFLRWHWHVDEERVAIGGYDVVAYHMLEEAVRGVPELESVHAGIRYWFVDEEHRVLFEEEPESYLPAFGGWDAYSMGSAPPTGRVPQTRVASDPNAFELADGRLLLFARQGGFDGRALWRAGDREAHLRRADAFWASREALAAAVGPKPEGLSANAPLETTQFDFFIGAWDSDYAFRTSVQNPVMGRIRGRWTAAYGWFGYAIYDDWVQLGAPPNASGPAVRSYSPSTREWIMHYIPINAPMTAVWSMTGQFDENGELHGELEIVDAQGQSALQRIHFRDITPNHFTWSCDRSYDGGETWHVDWGVGSNTRIE